MKRALKRGVRIAMRRLGVPGVLAVALLLPTALIVATLPRLARQADELQAALVDQREALLRRGPAPQRSAGAADAALPSSTGFPPLTQSAADLRRLFEIADKHRLALPKGEYQLKAEPNAPLVSYRISLPTQQQYGALKRFTADVLQALPHAALDELRMARPDTGSSTLETVIRLTLVYRGS